MVPWIWSTRNVNLNFNQVSEQFGGREKYADADKQNKTKNVNFNSVYCDVKFTPQERFYDYSNVIKLAKKGHNKI
jgi:hypothetical protein